MRRPRRSRRPSRRGTCARTASPAAVCSRCRCTRSSWRCMRAASSWPSPTETTSSTSSTTARATTTRFPRAARRPTCTAARRSSTTARTAWRSTPTARGRSRASTRRRWRPPRRARRMACGRSASDRTTTPNRLGPPRWASTCASRGARTPTGWPSTRRHSTSSPPRAPTPAKGCTPSPTGCGRSTCTITSSTRRWPCTAACRCCCRTSRARRPRRCGSTPPRRLWTCGGSRTRRWRTS
mmetsp:Transcript_9163/g.21531  ORF Transcript_9163/g.21531 Transcript_9163/m.21531 type:complete len:239 (-) Transcript_9163:2000-2716(-)